MTNPILKIIANKYRKNWAINDYNRDKSFTIPQNIQLIKDISYGPNKKWNLLDINLPKNADSPLACIVSFHGGGFFYGTKETYQFYAADLAGRDFAVINFNYRLSPENRYPKHLEDCNLMMSWLKENAPKYNIDLERLFFVGDSAGAHLAYFYSTILTNPDYAGLYNFKVPAVKPKAIALNCGLYNIDNDKNPILGKAYFGSVKNSIQKEKEIKNYISKDFPPTFITSAPNDFLLDQAKIFSDFLASKEILTKLKIYGSKEDLQACHVFHLNQKLEIAKNCNDDECDFFRTFN
ncbi:MAG: alpha/beta hydrolase [Treponema sp.]|nr:alpha/beta hydrolase [Treponema sp.]